MERVEGVILRPRDARRHAPATRAHGGDRRRLIDTLAELHAVDFEAAGLGDLGRPDGYVRRQVDGWTGRYDKARTDDIPEMTQVAAWLDADTTGAARERRGADPQRLQVRQPGSRPERRHAGDRRPRLGDGHGRRPADGPRHHPRLLGGPGRPARAAPAGAQPDAAARQPDPRPSWSSATPRPAAARLASRSSTTSTGCSRSPSSCSRSTPATAPATPPTRASPA